MLAAPRYVRSNNEGRSTLARVARRRDSPDYFPRPIPGDRLSTERRARHRRGGHRQAFANPIGSPRIAELARGKASAVIVVDDIARPTPAYRLVPYMLDELLEAGVPEAQHQVPHGLACHRPMTRRGDGAEAGRGRGAELPRRQPPPVREPGLPRRDQPRHAGATSTATSSRPRYASASARSPPTAAPASAAAPRSCCRASRAWTQSRPTTSRGGCPWAAPRSKATSGAPTSKRRRAWRV